MPIGPSLPISQETHEIKYRSPGETFEHSIRRQANALCDDVDHFDALEDIYGSMRFLNAGRVQAAVGSSKRVTAYNCFVSGTIDDSMDGIMQAASEAAQTMRLGGGIGFDFSTIRPRGADIETVASPASGPVSFMHIFDAVCSTISSAGNRRGAMMGVLRIDHPDIEEFIKAKQDGHSLTQFNLSIGVTDEFMQALKNRTGFSLRWGGEVYKVVAAELLWKKIMKATWEWAEPGVLFIDRMNGMNNLWYAEEIAATNPCAEQPLPPYGACLLGSFNMTQYMVKDQSVWRFNMTQFITDIPHVVRALDNVIDRTFYPLPEQEQEAKAKRRMGIGVTGMANALEAMGLPYGSEEYINMQDQILRTLTNEAYRASSELAQEKGAFPLYNGGDYLRSKFIQQLDLSVQQTILVNGMRNSHLTSIAPTGTISLTADNVSSGIEPTFMERFERTMKTWDGHRKEIVEDYGVRVFGNKPKTTKDCTIQDHLHVLAAAQQWVDSACSKTINLTGNETPEEFEQVYLEAYELGAKGCTTFNPKGKRYGILNEVKDDEVEVVEGAACFIDPNTGQKECS